MYALTSDLELKQRFRIRSGYLMIGSLLLAVIILAGWSLDIEFINSRFPHTRAMNPLSAVCFVLTGTSFLITHFLERKSFWHIVAYCLSLIVIMIGAVKLIDIVAELNLNIDLILFKDQVNQPGGQVNIMSPNTAFNFILVGSAIILSSRPGRFVKQLANYAALISLLVAVFAFIAYLYRVEDYIGILSYIPMALQSAIGFVLTGLALLFANSESGFMSILTSPYSGGTIARILLPTSIILPITIGYLNLLSQWRSPIPDELGVAFLITVIVLLFFLMIIYVSVIINNKDIQRKKLDDILERMNLELEQKVLERTEEVNRSERRYRSLIENSGEGISLLDSSLNPIYQSPAVTVITGYTLEERNKIPGMDTIHPDDQSEGKILFSNLLKNPGKPFRFQYRFLNKNGNYQWVEGVATNLLDDNDIKAIVTNYRDVTERKEAESKLAANEKRLRAILESSSDAFVITDENLAAKYQSPSAERMTGISLAYRLAHPEIRYTHPDDIPILLKLVEEIIKHPETPLDFQLRFLHSNGKYIWIEGVMTNLLGDKNVKGLTFNYRDITDRKNLEEQKAASEKRFRALIENISDAIILNDQYSNILYQSPSVTKILGYTPEERKGKRIIDYVHPDYKEPFIELYKNLEKSPGQPMPFQYRFLHKSGKYIWLEGVVTNLLHDPTVEAYVANYRDISDRKESEEKLLQERTLLRTIIDNIPDYIYVKDVESRHLINNKAMVDLLTASSEEETLGKSSIEFFGEKIATPYLEEDREIINSGIGKLNFEESTITPSGKFIYLLTTKVPLKDVNGKVTSLIGISHDITSQKQIELDLRNSKYFLEKAQQVGNTGHWILDTKNMQKLILSTETCRIFEIEPEQFDERLQTFYDFIHPEDLTLVKSGMESSIENNSSYSLDHRITLKNGNLKWVHEQGEATVNDKGETVFLIGIIQDITERKKAEEEIVNLNTELERRVELRTFQLQAANKEMEAFTYSVSHDLRAPLRIIDGFSQILIEDYSKVLDMEGQKNLEKIMKNAKRMGRLIDDLLDFSRLGRTEMKVSLVDMNILVKEVLEEIQISGINLPDHLRPENLLPAKGDYNLLKQVWTNLLTNAIKYSSKKSQPEILIGTTNEAGKTIYFVKDNGEGFDMQYYSKLFGVFQRLHKAAEFEGTGVGLALVQRIISRHGGFVWAEAKLHEGAVFYFSLPGSVDN